MPQMQLAAGLASAYNDWVIENVLSRDPRFKGSIAVAPQLPDSAAAEIDGLAGHPDIVQVALPTSSPDLPWGHPYFHPIWEAAVRNHLRVGMHLMPPTGLQGLPNGTGWPRSYMESRSQYPNLFEAQLISMIVHGVFEKIPVLGIVFLEGGFGWIPLVMWRVDQSWRSLRSEVPWLKQRPSEYIRAHVRFATQPFEEPDDPRQLLSLIEMMGSDELLVFSSDYPHWDFDAPANSLPPVLGKDLTEKILWGNAAKFYGLKEPAQRARARSVFRTRWASHGTENSGPVVSNFEVDSLYRGGGTNPFDAFADMTAVDDSWRKRVELSRTPVGEAIPLDEAGRWHVLAPAIRTLATFWAYDSANRALFTSDVFGHTTIGRADARPVIDDDATDTATYEQVREHLLSKFFWLSWARTRKLKADVQSLFEAMPVEIIAPSHGWVLVCRPIIERHVGMFLRCLD